MSTSMILFIATSCYVPNFALIFQTSIYFGLYAKIYTRRLV